MQQNYKRVYTMGMFHFKIIMNVYIENKYVIGL